MKTDVIIVGGGLSGLSLARQLERDGIDYRLFEAGARLGGRVLSLSVAPGAGVEDRVDLGPAWFWPGQPRIARLIDELGLERFDQYADGALLHQAQDGAVRAFNDFAPMAGSHRVVGGLQGLIERLRDALPDGRIALNARLTAVEAGHNRVEARIAGEKGLETWAARSIVLALPPRLAAETVTFHPPLSARRKASLTAVPTWMAGHAKVLAVYERPFWRSRGLSGDVISQRGPLVEVHDASPASGTYGALFGFVGVPPAARLSRGDAVVAAAKTQLAQVFGADAPEPLEVHYTDWAENGLVATESDYNGPAGHPDYRPIAPLSEGWNGRVIFSSTETGREFGGFLEGALEGAEQAARAIKDLRQPA